MLWAPILVYFVDAQLVVLKEPSHSERKRSVSECVTPGSASVAACRVWCVVLFVKVCMAMFCLHS
jgi:hypothetical protein